MPIGTPPAVLWPNFCPQINWWDNVYGFDMSCIKKLATVEPLVDTVNPNQIVTDFSEMVDLDCNTCTVADLQFKVPFKITAQRDDYIHGEAPRAGTTPTGLIPD